MKNYYKILDINKSASLKEIKKAYTSLVNRRPNIGNTDQDNIRRVLELKEAYNILTDNALRTFYDSKISKLGERFYPTFENADEIKEFIEGIDSQFDFYNQRYNEQQNNIRILKKESVKQSRNILKLSKDIDNLNSLLNIEKENNKQLNNSVLEYKTELDKNNKIERDNSILRKHNEKLLSKVKNNSNSMYKVILIVSLVFLFIILMLVIQIINL